MVVYAEEWRFDEVAGPFGLTEGPAWDGSGLLFTDIPNQRILRFDPRIGKTQVFRRETNYANGLVFDPLGQLYACEAGGRCIACYGKNGDRKVVADRFEGKRLNSPNDLAIDLKGRIWFTDPHYSSEWARDFGPPELDHKSVYRVDPQEGENWEIRRVTYDTKKPNGILVSLDMKTLYVAESDFEGLRELRAYPILKDESLGDYAVLHNFYPHRGIDGMCLDAEGNIVAAAGWERSGPGGMIYVFAPNGRVLATHPVLCARPTNCSWGDDDLETLYLASVCGRLYRARTGHKGWLLFP